VAHQSLYRKYRPQTFDAVVGQQHIERTLRNAVGDGTVAHAYLFTGPRGTGKTTTARILAKALNCQHGPTSEPDGTCEDCIEIAEGRHPDVYELDAASRTGVDNVREEIIGRVNFAPQRGRYKVYIIDEVHMLSTAAFNALLKTLEEPPSHVVFILATTHPHKVPDTIHSRCQRFDFHRIGIDDIVGRLRVICDGEGFNVPDAALALIARHASGGMRDAITTLEQLASFTGGTIGLTDVEGLLGEVDSAALFEIAGLVAHRDIAGCFRWVARFAEEGTDLAEFVRELTGHVRNLYLIAAVGDADGLIDATAEERGRLSSQAAEFGGPDRLARALDLLGELGSELRWSSDQRLSLEVSLTRMSRPQGEMTLEAVAERVEMLERMRAVTGGSPVAAGPKPSGSGAQTAAQSAAFAKSPEASGPAATSMAPAPSAAPPAAPTRPEASRAEVFAAPAEPVQVPVSMGALDRAAARRAWPAVLVEIKKLRPARASQYGDVEVDVDTDGTTLVLEFPNDQSFARDMAEEPEMRDMLKMALAAVLGSAPPVRLQLGRGSVRPPVDDETGPTPASVRVAAPHPWDTSADEAPLPEYYETGDDRDDAPSTREASAPAPAAPALAVAAPAPQPATGAEPQTELEKLLVGQLGGVIVAQHATDPATSPVDAEDLSGTEDDAETEPQDQGDPGLFDTDGED
jgi:DNA polymerase-3 subunit gamma/tau